MEVGPDYVPEVVHKTRYVSDAWMDGQRSPIDGADIGSRTKLREHMKQHGVAHHAEVAQDVERIRASQAATYQADTKQDVLAALEAVSAGARPDLPQYDGPPIPI